VGDQAPIYQQYGLTFETIQIDWHPSSFLANYLDEVVKRDMPCPKELLFIGCYRGLPRLIDWLRERKTGGQSIHKVTLTDCGDREGQTRLDYEALRDPGLVEEVEWR
jgi:hypothetical protein